MDHTITLTEAHRVMQESADELFRKLAHGTGDPMLTDALFDIAWSLDRAARMCPIQNQLTLL